MPKIIPWAVVGLVAGFLVGLSMGSNTRRGVGDAVEVKTEGSDLVVTVSGNRLLRSSIGLR